MQLADPAWHTSRYTHLSEFRRAAGWQIPWAIGYTTRAAHFTATTPAWETRTASLLANFRPMPNQHVRNGVDLGHGPWLAPHFAFDRSISGQHYERLLAYQACLAVGGMFFEDLTLNGFFSNQKGHRDLARKAQFFRATAVVRWDSWRFYESLAAGCLTLQLDLEKYGLALPVIPVRWKHYIPLTFADPKRDIERMMDLRSEWPIIAAASRDWVQAHYSPRASAQRLLDYAVNQFNVPGWGPLAPYSPPRSRRFGMNPVRLFFFNPWAANPEPTSDYRTRLRRAKSWRWQKIP